MKRLTHDIKFPTGKGKFDVWIFAICIFCLTMPFYMWQINTQPIIIVSALVLLKNFGKGKQMIIGIIMLVLYLYVGVISKWSFLGILFLLLLIPIFFSKSYFLKQSLDVYIYIFSIMMIPSLLIYIIINVFNIEIPHTYITSLNESKTGAYSQYLFMVNYYGKEILVDNILPRFYGYFDEPGVVGTIAAVIMYVKKFNLKSWVNIPIFIAGLLSFSLTFYLLSLLYLFIIVQIKYKLLLIPILLLLFFLLFDNKVLNYYVIDRLAIDSTFLKSFLTRRDGASFEKWYSNFQESAQYLTGMGAGYSLKVNVGGNSYKNLITDFGIIFFTIYLGSFVLYGIRLLGYSKELIMVLLILFSTVYQRPFILDLSYVFLIFAPFVFFQVIKQESFVQLRNE